MSKGRVAMECVDEKLAKAIECPICVQVLAEPKTLHCGHTFCASCILKMWPKNQSNPYDSVDKQGTPIICPLCRQPSLLCGNMLPTNTALQSIVCHVIKQQENGVPCTSCGQQVMYSAQALCETCFEQSSNITLLCFSCACGIHAKAGHTVVQRAKAEGHLQNEVLPRLYELSEKAKWMANDAARSAKSAASFLTDTTFLNEAVQTFEKTARKLESLTYCTESFAAENVHAMEQLFGRFEQAVEDFDNLLGSTVARIGRFKERATERFFEPEAVSSSKPEAGSSSRSEAGNRSKTEAGSSSVNSNEGPVVIGSETRAATDESRKASCQSVTAKLPAKPEVAASGSGTCERKKEPEKKLSESVTKPLDQLSRDLSSKHIIFGKPDIQPGSEDRAATIGVKKKVVQPVTGTVQGAPVTDATESRAVSSVVTASVKKTENKADDSSSMKDISKSESKKVSPPATQSLYFGETFSEINLRRDVLHGLKDNGISKPNSLQKYLLYPCITGRNVIVAAPKGSGKLTAACLTILHKIDLKLPHVQALIFVPQRGMANRVCELLSKLAKNAKLVCYALSSKDSSYLESFKATSEIHIIVGCANRIENLVRNDHFSVTYMKVLIFYDTEVILPTFIKGESAKMLKQMIANFQTVLLFKTLSANHFSLSKQLVKNPFVFSQGFQQHL